MQTNTTQSLSKNLSPFHIWALAFGCIIGWGSFINPGKKFLFTSGVAGTAIAMILGAIVMITIAFSYAYMVPKYPQAGGEFVFAKNCFGKYAAFLCGWFLVIAYLSNVPMNSTAIGLIVDGLDGSLNILKWGFHYQIAGFDVWLGEILLASGILLLFGYINIIGVKKAGNIQILLSALLISSVLILFFAMLFSKKSSFANLQPIWGFDKKQFLQDNASIKNIDSYYHISKKSIISAVLATFAIAPWAYVGFDTIPQAVEECNFSFKKITGIMIIAILFGCFVYISNNTVSAIVLQNWPERVINGEWVLLIAAEELLGLFGKILIGISVFCAVLSGIMGFYLASSRLLFSISRDGYLPSWFSYIDEKYGTPRNAILFCMIISLSGPFLGREALGWFVDMSAIGASIGYFFTSAATFVSIRHEQTKHSFLCVISILGMIFSILFMILQLIPISGLNGVHFCMQSYLFFVIWIILGVFFFLRIRKRI